MPDDPIAQTLTLLEDERNAIRAADFAMITALSDKKQQLFDDLAQIPTTRAAIKQVKDALSVNHALLGAAISGMDAARERLAVLENVRGGLSVYDQSGQIAKVPTKRPAIERKA